MSFEEYFDIAFLTNAQVASCVSFVSTLAVGAVGVPVNPGLALVLV